MIVHREIKKRKLKNEYGLTLLECRGIKLLRKAGWTLADLSKHYKVGQDVIKYVIKTKIVAHMFYYES